MAGTVEEFLSIYKSRGIILRSTVGKLFVRILGKKIERAAGAEETQSVTIYLY